MTKDEEGILGSSRGQDFSSTHKPECPNCSSVMQKTGQSSPYPDRSLNDGYEGSWFCGRCGYEEEI